MARIHMEGVVEELERNFTRTLNAMLDEIVPGNTLDEKTIMRSFRSKLDRGFDRWERVPDRYVDMGD